MPVTTTLNLNQREAELAFTLLSDAKMRRLALCGFTEPDITRLFEKLFFHLKPGKVAKPQPAKYPKTKRFRYRPE